MRNGLSVVVYDGECPFCLRQIARIRAWDPGGRFEYLPRQTDGIEERFPILATSDFDVGMRLIEPGGRVHVGADAVYEIARRLPRTRWAAWLYRVPGLHGVAREAYGWIARNRRRLGRACGPDGCPVPTPD